MITKPSSSRRKFLTTLGIGGAAAATVAALQSGGQIEQRAAGTATPRGEGYRLTGHVRNYYRTAKL